MDKLTTVTAKKHELISISIEDVNKFELCDRERCCGQQRHMGYGAVYKENYKRKPSCHLADVNND